MIPIHPVIRCDGSGTRLWPLSRAGLLKQLLCLTGNENLFWLAVKRFSSMGASDIQVAAPIVLVAKTIASSPPSNYAKSASNPVPTCLRSSAVTRPPRPSLPRWQHNKMETPPFLLSLRPTKPSSPSLPFLRRFRAAQQRFLMSIKLFEKNTCAPSGMPSAMRGIAASLVLGNSGLGCHRRHAAHSTSYLASTLGQFIFSSWATSGER